jgi:pimeloyl-ACP methyl ester carboxylesterase
LSRISVRLCALFCVLFTQFAFAAPQVQPLEVNAENITLKGVRFLNPDGSPVRGPKILLAHGLTSNFHEFEALAAFLARKGFDCYAFNFRGHGNDDERSAVTAYHRGDYSFDKMWEIDFPAMLKYVGGENSEPVTIIGHSMGGMVPRAALAEGTVQPAQFRNLMMLGSPSLFNHAKMPWDFLPFLNLHEIPLWFGSGEGTLLGGNAVKQFQDLMTGLKTSCIGANFIASLCSPLVERLSRGLVRGENFSSEDDWKDRAMSSSVPKDIFRSFANFRSRGFKYADARVPVPVLHIAGSDDRLAPWEDIHQQTKIQSANGSWETILIDGVSHLDLVAARVIKVYKADMIDFIVNRDIMGPQMNLFMHQTMNPVIQRTDCDALLNPT